MAGIFDVQGFGALSEWNGQFSSASADQAYQTIAALGSNSIELTVRIWTDTGTGNTVIADPNKTESDASLLASFQAAEADGLSVVFKPNLSPLDGTPTSSMAPSDVAAFFASYEAEIVHLATLAQEGGVTTFAIGNEMSSLSGAQYLPYWTDIIDAVRQVYHGQLTYAAATDEASKVSFWSELDVIGVNTYPPLTTDENPTVQQLVQAWNEVPTNPYWAAAFENQSPVDFLHSLSEQYGKQVLMTEVGYRSMDGTAIEPGSWTSSGTPDPNAQATAFKAFFQVWSAEGGSWLQGAEIWQWDLSNQYSATGYSPMDKPAEAVIAQYFHGDGTASQAGFTTDQTVQNADGSRDVYTAGIVGQNFASEHDVIGTTGDTTLIDRYYASGTLAFTQELNSDGSVVQATYDMGGHLTQFAIDYTNGTFDQLTFDTSGNEAGETIRHADGSRDIYAYEIAGQAYTSQHVATDASGHSTLIDQYGADGSLLLQQMVDANGVKTIDQYDDLGHLTEQTVMQTDGSYTQSNYASNGSLTSETLRHVDGSRDIYTYGIAGQAYASQHVVNDPSGHSTLIDQYRADGSLLLEQTVNAAGVKTVDQYDDLGHLTQQMVQTDGTYVQSNFAADSSLLSETTRNVDGSREVDTYQIAGQSYSARHDVINAAGHTLAVTFDNNDGSHIQTANVSGVTITAAAGSDVINSAGGDNFVFTQAESHAASQVTINHFQADEVAGHDVLEISSALAPDLAHLSIAVAGHDTVISLGHDVTITLAGVTAALTPHDLLIV